jgi:hypothetical protein
MEIKKVQITRTAVHLEYENEGDTYKYESSDKPLPSFYNAVKALAPLVIETLDLPKSYVGREPQEGDKTPGLPLRVVGVTFVTKGESRQVLITATKVLALTPSPFNITVPLRYMDQPTKEGATSEPYGKKHVNLLEDVIEQAKAYLRGERAQGTLPLETEEQARAEPEDGNQEQLPGT